MISEELIAAYLDGNTTYDETMRIVRAMQEDKNLSRLILNSYMIDDIEDCSMSESNKSSIFCCNTSEPVFMAAKNEEHNCEVRCEKWILSSKGVATDFQKLVEEAMTEGWLTEEGTKLEDFGKLLERTGIVVRRKRNATLQEIKQAIDLKLYVIVAVDGGELIGDQSFESFEDQCIGKIPDHAVVVTAYDDNLRQVSIYDPTIGDEVCEYSYNRFLDAWDDSENYLVIAE